MKFIFLAIFLLMASTADATTWYADNSRPSDASTCTQAQTLVSAKKTITAALACVGAAGSTSGAGHTVEVAAGTYTDTLVDKIPSGSSTSAVFTLKCATDLACTLNPGSGVYGLGFGTASSYIEVRGFTTTTGPGWYLSGFTDSTHHHITFRNNDIAGNADSMGIQSSGASQVTVVGNLIHGHGSSCTGLGPGYCHGIYVADMNQSWVIENNDIYRSQ